MKTSTANKWLGLLVCAYAGTCLLILQKHGVLHGGDSERYTEGAAHISRGISLIEKQASYVGYIWLVYVSELIDSDLRSLIWFQVLLAALAGLALFDLGRKFHSNECGLLAAALFLGNPDIGRWHFIILTDSIYISVVVLFLWTLSRLDGAVDRHVLWAALVLSSSLVAASIRPNGWFLIPIGVTAVLIRHADRSWKRWVTLSAVMSLFIAGLFFLPLTQSGIQAEGPTTFLRQGVLVWGYTGWRIAMPEGPVSEVAYALSHPFSLLRVGLLRIVVELAHVRPFYSFLHNLIVLVFLMPLYVMAIVGYGRLRAPLFQFGVAAIIVVHLLVIAFMWADWDGRFLLHVLPLIGLLGAVGISEALVSGPRRLVERYTRRARSC